MFWALFVVGHDCGHQSFSSNRKLNDFVGNIVHASILVPYHGWRISHRTHHANHGAHHPTPTWLMLVQITTSCNGTKSCSPPVAAMFCTASPEAAAAVSEHSTALADTASLTFTQPCLIISVDAVMQATLRTTNPGTQPQRRSMMRWCGALITVSHCLCCTLHLLPCSPGYHMPRAMHIPLCVLRCLIPIRGHAYACERGVALCPRSVTCSAVGE